MNTSLWSFCMYVFETLINLSCVVDFLFCIFINIISTASLMFLLIGAQLFDTI